METAEVTELLIERLKKTKSNKEFMSGILKELHSMREKGQMLS